MTSQPRQALGRGLSALIPQTATASGVETVDIDLIGPNPEQPRVHFEATALEELAQSIKAHGILQPLLVTQVESDLGPRTYRLIAGERRLEAARRAGLDRVPVVVREAAGPELMVLALIENLQREDLNPLEEANAFRRLKEDFAMTQEEIAERVGRSRTRVANIMRLLSLEEEIRASLTSGQITEGHARSLLAIDDRRVRLDVWRRIVADDLTVRQAEEIAKQIKMTTRPAGAVDRTSKRVDPHVRAIEDELRGYFGAPVTLKKGRVGGSLVIRFHSDEELDGIIARMRG
jgi:ParB family chromosome partitioning protein